MAQKQKHIIVVGAGIAGLSSAIWLRRAGYAVTVLDKGAPGQGTSYGNAGVLANCSVVPVTGPGLIRKAPGMLMSREFPLYLRWGYLPKLLPWLVRYMRHANDKDTRRIARGLAVIVADSVEQHKALIKGTAAENWITDSDYCFGYRDQAAFDADGYALSLRREAGFEPEVLKAGAVQEYDPALGRKFGVLAVMRDHAYIKAPGEYVAALAGVLHDEGGVFRQAEVRDFELGENGVRAVITDQGRMECDRVVLTTGAASKPLCRKLGLNVPLESERGYHIVFKNPSFELRSPVMVAAGKFVATPMKDGLRVAGTVEFGGLDAGPSKAPIEFIKGKVSEYFPSLEYDGTEEWLGHRPATSDSLPLVGEIGNSGVFANFGHHHIGLTSGPKTGRMLADIIAHKRSNLDLAPFDPKRFT